MHPRPVDYGSIAYWAIHAVIRVGAAGNRHPVRYRREPVPERAELNAEEADTCPEA
ncbi:hypothetical protein GCM10022207_47340 [Streptomyces lannensis]|uniref:Uncharacterized protein n=1 Tax=Streptomyces lannensis TaxID=766498 RepID=A0ABP7KFU1_9ACTN